MIVLAIDPGNLKSAWLVYDSAKMEILEKGINPNGFVIELIAEEVHSFDELVIEYPRPRGQPMYTQLVDVIFWIGRFVQSHGGPWNPMDRKDVKMHLCGSTKAKDSNIRAAILSRFSSHPKLGGGKQPEVGTKKKPGPLFGISKDLWAALGVALTYAETNIMDLDFLN